MDNPVPLNTLKTNCPCSSRRVGFCFQIGRIDHQIGRIDHMATAIASLIVVGGFRGHNTEL